MGSRRLRDEPERPEAPGVRPVEHPGASFLRIVYFTGGGPFGLLPLEALAAEHDILAIIVPLRSARPWRRWAVRGAAALGIRRQDEVIAWARRRRVPRLVARSGRDARLIARLRFLAPDLACIATFSWLLHGDLLAIPRLGAVNLHPSLLPRHRGANPYFWTYYRDDRHAGLTVHVATESPDGGPILTQHTMPLPRGWPVHEFYLESAREGAELLRRAVHGLGSGNLVPTPQDDARATAAPRVRSGEAMVDFDAWNVERVWHFLHGLHPRFQEPLRDGTGKAVAYTRVLGYEEGRVGGRPGTVEPDAHGWRLWCRDGYLHLVGPGERRSALERDRW